MPRVGIVLAGCGVFDGAEIREAVFALLAVEQEGAEYRFYAPDIAQRDVVDHAKGAAAHGERRNVLSEAARIARGDIAPLAQAKASDCDAWVYPGGFGVAKNLCSFAVDGAKCTVLPDAARLIREAHEAGVAQCFCCISPALAARAFQEAGVTGVRLTIGDDAGTAEALRTMGAEHVAAPVEACVIDERHRVVSTPAYMYGEATTPQVFAGIQAAVKATLALAGQPVA